LRDNRIMFSTQYIFADDVNGDSCTSSVVVGVSHNKNSAAIDSGPRFNSTQ
jgi:hypothetical protein